ncbi:hypothetical protein ACFV1L_21015 [Kitasatospora sp. NPDC059646]|uniref:hypothetical protein n=1 Tax=Kitasatospora sp. NPDC059646 TaxID=3346893 RepID=UPI00368207FF
MPLPAWTLHPLPSDQPFAMSTAALRRLLAWLDDPQQREAWRSARRSREIALIEAERTLAAAEYSGRRQADPARIVELRESTAEARGLAGLTALAEDVAECSRLRITAALRRPGTDSAETVEELTTQIEIATRCVNEALTTAHYADPAEAHRHLTAVLDTLTNRHRAARATASVEDLEAWAQDLELALDMAQLTLSQA